MLPLCATPPPHTKNLLRLPIQTSVSTANAGTDEIPLWLIPQVKSMACSSNFTVRPDQYYHMSHLKRPASERMQEARPAIGFNESLPQPSYPYYLSDSPTDPSDRVKFMLLGWWIGAMQQCRCEQIDPLFLGYDSLKLGDPVSSRNKYRLINLKTAEFSPICCCF